MLVKKLFCVITVLALCTFSFSCSYLKDSKSVTVASKQFTENVLLSEMYAQLIENHTEIQVSRRQRMGNAVCFPAMEAGEVDIYVEYTGTVYKEILQRENDPELDTVDFFNLIKSELSETKNVTAYPSVGVNNTFALAMREDYARVLGIKTMSDLSAAAPELVFAANEGFYARINDGYDMMIEQYGMRFKSSSEMDTNSIYSAIGSGQVDVMVAFSTDPQLQEYNMVILEDDMNMFPEYYAVPLIRNDVLEQFPELKNVMALLNNRISDERMQKLNHLVDFEDMSVEEVADIFLTEEGLLQ